MEDELRGFASEATNEEENHGIDVSQKSILSFFKPVTGKLSKPQSILQADPKDPNENICCSYDDRKKQPVNEESIRMKNEVKKDQVNLSIKPKNTTSNVKVNLVDSGVLSISGVEDEVDLSRAIGEVENKKSRKKKIKTKKEKCKGDLVIPLEKGCEDGIALESPKYDEHSEKEVDNGVITTCTNDHHFLSQVNDIMETRDDEVDKRRKSQRTNCKKNDEGKETNELSISGRSDVDDRSRCKFSGRKKKNHLEDADAVIMEIDHHRMNENPLSGDEIESIKNDIGGKGSVARDKETECSDRLDMEHSNTTKGGTPLGEKKKEKKRKKQIHEFDEMDQLLQNSVATGEQDDSPNIIVGKVTGGKLSTDERIKNSQECEFDVDSTDSAPLQKEECNSGKRNRRKVKGFSERHDHMELKENNGSLHEEEITINNVIESKINDKNVKENKKIACAEEEIKAEADNMLLRDTRIKNEDKNLEEDGQLAVVKDGKSVKRDKRMRSRRKKNVGSDALDFDCIQEEEVTKDMLVSKDEFASDCIQVLSRRKRRQHVNYVESLSIDGDDDNNGDDDDDDFQPQLRKSMRSNTRERRNELKSSNKVCSKKSLRSSQGSKGENGKENGCTGMRGTELIQSTDTARDSLMNSKKEKISEEEDGKVFTMDLKGMKESAASYSTTSFLAKFAKPKIVKYEENSIVEQETALPCISHTLQLDTTEREWYQSATNRLIHCNISPGPRHPAILPLVSKECDWVLLVNLSKRPSREVSTKTQQFVSLATAIADILKCDPLLPLVKLLKSYVNCQMNVVKQCLAKVEIPKSNLKTIWEKQEKVAKKDIVSINLVEIQPVKQGVDIRSMFKKANSKASKKPKSNETEDIVPVEKGDVITEGIDECLADDMQTKKDASKNSRKRKKDKKESSKKNKDVEFDSSIEIVSIEETVLKTCKNTIEDSFTKITKKGQYEKKISERADQKEICENERKELNSSLRSRSKKLLSKCDMTVDEDFISVEDETDKRIFSRKSKRDRRKKVDRSEVVDSSCNEAEEKKDMDSTENGLMKKKGGKRKRKVSKGGRDEDIVNEMPEGKMASESNVSPSLSDQVRRGRKRIRKTDTERKDDVDLPTSNENIGTDQCSKLVLHDIRTMFCSAKNSSKGKEFDERKTEVNNKEQRKPVILEKDVVLTNTAQSPIDKIEEPLCKTQQNEVMVLEEQKSNTIDIRCLFSKRREKVANIAKALKECDDSIAEEPPASTVSVEMEAKESSGDKTTNIEEGSNLVGTDIGKNSEERGIVTRMDYREKKVDMPEDERAVKVCKVEDVKQQPANVYELEASESMFDRKAEQSVPPAVVSMMDITSYFKPSAKKSKHRSDAVSVQNSDLRSFSPEFESFSKRSETNDVCSTDSDIKTFLSVDGESCTRSESVVGSNGAEQDNRYVEKSGRIETFSEDKSDREFQTIDKMVPGEDKKTLRDGTVLSACILKQESSDGDLVISDKSEEDYTETEKTMSKLSSSSAEQCVRTKRKRDSNPVLAPLARKALDECDDTPVDSKTKEAKRVKIDKDTELKEELCNDNLEVNSMSLDKSYRNVRTGNLNTLTDFELQNSQNNEKTETVLSCCNANDVGIHEQSICVSEDSDDEIMAFHAKQTEPDSLTDGTCSTVESSSSEETNDSTEAVCDSETDVVSLMEASDSERVSNENCKLDNGSAMQDSVDNGRLDIEAISNGVVSGQDVGLEYDDISPKRAKEPANQTGRSDETGEVYTKDSKLEDEAAGLPTDGQEVISLEIDCDDNDLESEKNNVCNLPKRTRNASSVSHDDKIPEENGRRRSSRVKQREEQRLEEERRRREELEKMSHEAIKDKVPAVKRRKSRKVSESVSESLKSEAAGDEDSDNKHLVTEESRIDFPTKPMDCVLEAKREDTADNEEVKVIEMPPIDEDYVNSSLLWTEKYAPARHDQLIGNWCQTKQIFDWLSIWKEKHENFVLKFIAKNNSRYCGKTDVTDSDDSSDDDDDNEPISNTFVITSKTGCGSTATVYACAQELGYKVLEMHPSNYRSGKQIQALLGEATQSHQVKRRFHGSGGDSAPAANEESHGSKNICSFFGSKSLGSKIANSEQKNEDVKEPEKETEENSENLKDSNVIVGEMSLVLFEQADVVFDEQDKGFWFGLNELRRQAKRPIIITTNDPSSKTRLDGDPYEAVTMHYAEERLIVNHLLAMCLAESVTLPRFLVENIVKNCNRDIRKSILKLQFTYEQWIKPCHGRVDCAIKKLSKINDMEDLNKRENLLERGTVQDSVISNPNSVVLDSTFCNRQPICLIDEDSKVTSCGSKLKDLPPRETGEVEFKAPVMANSIQCEVKDVKVEETDGLGAIVSQEDCSFSAQVTSGELKTETSASDLERVNDNRGMEEREPGDRDVTGLVKEEAVTKEEAFIKEEMFEEEEKEQMVMVVELGITCNSEDGDLLFQNEQIDKCGLTRLNTNLSQSEKNRLDSLSDASSILTMVSASADALSFADTLCDKWHPTLNHSAHRHGWWFARTSDGTADEERFSDNGFMRNDVVLEKISRDVLSSYKYVHESILDEHDKEAFPLSLGKSDVIRQTYSRLEDCLPSSVKTDHRSLCLDTIPNLSNICQSEESRRATQHGRRSRRFLHYLDTIGLHLDSKIREQLIRTSLADS